MDIDFICNKFILPSEIVKAIDDKSFKINKLGDDDIIKINECEFYDKTNLYQLLINKLEYVPTQKIWDYVYKLNHITLFSLIKNVKSKKLYLVKHI